MKCWVRTHDNKKVIFNFIKKSIAAVPSVNGAELLDHVILQHCACRKSENLVHDYFCHFLLVAVTVIRFHAVYALSSSTEAACSSIRVTISDWAVLKIRRLIQVGYFSTKFNSIR